MTIPWKQVATVCGVILSSTATGVLNWYQNKQQIANVGKAVGEEILNNLNKK